MDLPTLGFRALATALILASLWFTAQVELRRASLAGDAAEAGLARGDIVRVVAAIDGDELSVARGEHTATVRLVGIKAFDAVDEPDLGNPGARATEALRAFVGRDAAVWPEGPGTDASGRALAYLATACPPDDPTCAPVDLGAEQLRLGMAFAYTKYPFERLDSYLAVEAEARAAGRGIWAFPEAVRRVDAARAEWADER